MDGLDPNASQVLLMADSRKHKQLRSIHHAGAQHDLPARPYELPPAIFLELDTHGSRILKEIRPTVALVSNRRFFVATPAANRRRQCSSAYHDAASPSSR